MLKSVFAFPWPFGISSSEEAPWLPIMKTSRLPGRSVLQASKYQGILTTIDCCVILILIYKDRYEVSKLPEPSKLLDEMTPSVSNEG